MSAFSADWLNLRAPFDRTARSSALVRGFGDALRAARHAPLRLVDLAAGHGAGLMALAPAIGGDQEWLLVDGDPQLLAAQAGTVGRWAGHAGWSVRPICDGVQIDTGAARWRVRSLHLDLAQSLESIALAGCHGVATSAFLDLVSADWIDRLCAQLARHRLPLLAMLTVDGRREWHPALPEDAAIEAAFRRHQGGDKGFGPALGASAVSCLTSRIGDRGYATRIERSDWRIGSGHREMLLRMVAEAAAVAKEMAPEHTAAFDAWADRRAGHIAAGGSTLYVGHLDVLALPR